VGIAGEAISLIKSIVLSHLGQVSGAVVPSTNASKQALHLTHSKSNNFNIFNT
jgi:hypothetical protein